jgi:hypothetical protein
MPDESRTSDNLDQSVDGGIDKAMAANGAYQSAQNIGSAAAAAASSAAQNAAAAGTSAAAATGTGAAVGTAAGPGGTVLGTVIGLAVSLFAKPLIKGSLVIILFLVMVFSSLPSMLFEQTTDMADNTGPASVYQQCREYVAEAYKDEIEKRKEAIEDDFQARIDAGEFDEYDHVEFTYSLNPTENAFLGEIRESCILIIAMFEIHMDDWRKAAFADFKNTVDRAGFWNGSVTVSKVSEESEVTYEIVDDGDDDDEDDEESTIHVHISYDMFDNGVEVVRGRLGLANEREFVKSVEMAYNIKLYFGEADGLPMGGITGGGSGSYPGGGTHNAIREALAELEEKPAFYGGSAIIPLASYISVSSEFGPRNYAPDPIHTGIDFSANSGTAIYAAMDGVVLLRLTNTKTFGRHIVVYHGGNITTMYAHMSSFGSYQVGARVRRGDVIGNVGRTGLSTGNHLHFEYQKGGAAHNPRLILPL